MNLKKYWKNICLWIIAALLFYSGIQNYASMEESNAAVIELYGTYPDQKRAEEILCPVQKQRSSQIFVLYGMAE